MYSRLWKRGNHRFAVFQLQAGWGKICEKEDGNEILNSFNIK